MTKILIYYSRINIEPVLQYKQGQISQYSLAYGRKLPGVHGRAKKYEEITFLLIKKIRLIKAFWFRGSFEQIIVARYASYFAIATMLAGCCAAARSD